jgi:hypothetical protein
MRANEQFTSKPKYFFEATRLISERVGYSTRRTSAKESVVKTVNVSEANLILKELGISENADVSISDICDYISFRAETLNVDVKPNLMDRERAKALYERERESKNPKTPPIMNKQKGDKRHESYLACLVQTQAEHILGFNHFDNDPQKLAFLTDSNSQLMKCFARRFDGCVPSINNPKVVWEIKEYYGTTTFGSRVADGVYETLLDGYEIVEARERGCEIEHYLFVDDYFTWWVLGKSYLRRIIDMLHTGHVDKVYFGEQVVTQFPSDLSKALDI